MAAIFNTTTGVIFVTGWAGSISGGSAVFSGTIQNGDGTVGAPSYSFASQTDLGIYKSAGSTIAFARNSTTYVTFDLVNSHFNLGVDGFDLRFGANNDVVLTRDAANVLALKNANSAQEFRIYAGNGAFSGITTVNESLTIAAAATTDSATTIPAGSIILGVSVRVTTVIPTAATFTVTAATGGNTFNTAAVSVAANSTDKGTAAGALYTSAGTKVRITPNLTPGTATGVVRLAIYYFNPTAPTS